MKETAFELLAKKPVSTVHNVFDISDRMGNVSWKAYQYCVGKSMERMYTKHSSDVTKGTILSDCVWMVETVIGSCDINIMADTFITRTPTHKISN